VQYYFKWYLALACEARDRAAADERETPGAMPGDAFAAIVMAALSLEVFINEATIMTEQQVLLDEQDRLPAADEILRFACSLRPLVDGKAEIKAKYEVAASALTGRGFDHGAAPYKDFSQLVKLRNHIVHLKAEPSGSLVGHFRLLGYTRPVETFTAEDGHEHEVGVSPLSSLATARMAAWSCSVAEHMIVTVLRMFPDGLRDPLGMIKQTFPPYTAPNLAKS
jgi:hypothetical protein